MAAVKDGRELLKIIVNETQPVFGFYDIGLSVLDKSGEFYDDWTVLYEEINPSDANAALREAHNYKIPVDTPLFKYGAARVEAEKKPFVDNLTPEFIELAVDFPHLQAQLDFGFKQFLVTTLKFGDKTFGFLNFNSRRENHFDNCDFQLFQAVADLVAVAVANITANKEILEREREKSRLLEITKLIAQIKANDELLRLIVDKIKPLFGFEDCGLFVVSADKETHTDLAAVIPGVSPSEFNKRISAAAVAQDVPHSASIVERMMREIETAGKPVLFDFVDLVEQFPDYPQFVGTNILELGYRDCLATNLVVRGESIGMFCINARAKNFFAPQMFPLFQAVAHSISIAVANILASEEILERAREKSNLLAISREIAKVQTRRQLLDVIFNTVKNIFPYDDAGLFYFCDPDGKPNPNGACHVHLLDDLISSINSELTAKGITGVLCEGTPTIRFCATDHAQIIKLSEIKRRAPGHPHYPLMEKFGIRQMITTGIKSGGETIGMLCFNSFQTNFYHEKNVPLFENIANQISIALANILANDAIKNQLAEIKELKKRLEAENVYLSEEIGKNYNFAEIVGASQPLQQVFAVVEQVASTDATVLIQGETGTGKELIARAVHDRSPRSARPLIKINCAALPRELIESELFGHERGSFTGATERRVGKFELANNSTIFLDEIGELPPEMQVKLLHVLQEREIERVGGKGTIKLDFRVVAATNRNLAQEVQAGRFRADLYYRLCTVELFMPPLRERRADIESLTMYFARKYAAKFSRRIERVSAQMLAELLAYDFPGNVRELEHIVEHAVIFSRDEKLVLPRPLLNNRVNQIADLVAAPETVVNAVNFSSPNNENQTLRVIEREHIAEVLRQTAGRIKGKRGAAEILGLNPATVYFRMKKLGIEKSK